MQTRLMQVKTITKSRRWEYFFLIFLLLYPLRHISWGLDLMDTGYNYANFKYMGLEHMDSMWLFSTYLAHGTGHILTMLPFADGLMGMNFYTGLFVSLLGIMGYLFCTRVLKINMWLAFLGEFAAVSLCWCPTALLYNYLTYVLFLGCVVLLYMGLAGKKAKLLFCAGLCLGANVLVRFPNLAQAAMILAVWAYGILEIRETQGAEDRKRAAGGILRNTLFCLGGYLTVLAVLYLYLHARYGLPAYMEAITRLFAMTDSATDYKASSMLVQPMKTYISHLYWVVRMGVIWAAGVAMFAMAGWLAGQLEASETGSQAGQQKSSETKHLAKRLETSGAGYSAGRLETSGTERPAGRLEASGTGCTAGHPKTSRHAAARLLMGAAYALWGIMSAVMLAWLYYRSFCTLDFADYSSMEKPAILFLMLALAVAFVRICQKSCPKNEKLISIILILVVFLTSIGSNNNVYPSINNLFVAAPYTLWQSVRLLNCKYQDENWPGRLQGFLLRPFKGLLAAFLAMFLFQSAGFGTGFVFVESKGARDVTAQAANNEMLAGIKMSPQRAEWMTGITSHATENGLAGREVILYGDIPSLSYYLQMPAAFNPWCDLPSYNYNTMLADMEKLRNRIDAGVCETPVIIARCGHAEDDKWLLIAEFMEDYGYGMTFCNERFLVYEAQ